MNKKLHCFVGQVVLHITVMFSGEISDSVSAQILRTLGTRTNLSKSGVMDRFVVKTVLHVLHRYFLDTVFSIVI